MAFDRAEAAALDAADPLAVLVERFAPVGGGAVYLDGNSLGRLPLRTRDRVRALLDDWGERAVGGWHDWIDLPVTAGDELAGLIGAGAGEVLVCDSVTVNLFKLASAILEVRPGAIVHDPADFPTDRYVLAGLAERHGRTLHAVGDAADGLPGGELALVCLSHVDYRSGALADMAAITAAAHERGARVIWDLCHSAGVVPVELADCAADAAVGCTYKYLNAGPGAPGFLYVRGDLSPQLRSPIQGWFGQAGQFEMGPAYEPAAGISRFLAGTPGVVGTEMVRAGLVDIAEAGVAALREKSIRLTELLIDLHDRRLAPLGFELATPRDAGRRGAHVALRHPDAWRICRALIDRALVIPDFRGPDVVRLGPVPLSTHFVDVWDAVDRIAGSVERGDHLGYDRARTRVT